MNSEALHDRDNSFAEKHVRWSRQARDDATSIGSNLIECTQSLVIMVGYYHLTARWVEVWASAGLAVRTWLRNLNASKGGRSILPDPDNAIEKEQRANLFWIAYSYERFQTAVGPWDTFQLCAWMTRILASYYPSDSTIMKLGIMSSITDSAYKPPNFLTTHVRETTDSFTLFVKASVILSKVKILSLRAGNRYPNIPDIRDTPAFRHLESTIATFRQATCLFYNTSKGFDTLIYVAHLIPHTAIILMHEEHANVNSPNCLSTQKSLLAARAILDLIYLVCSTSYDVTRLPSVCTFCWFMAARVLVRVLKHRHQSGQMSEATTMRSEVEVIKLAFKRMSERIPLARRHCQMLDDLLETELHSLDDVIYGTCTYEKIFDPAYIHEGSAFDWPDQGTLVEVTQETPTTVSASTSSHLPTPEAGVVPDPGPTLMDAPSSAQATLEQLLQSMDSDSFLLASGYADLTQFSVA
ncbi:hypothetical protein RSOL_443120, partial [Rhizoctonia solani AG-3 Rhs1AP]